MQKRGQLANAERRGGSISLNEPSCSEQSSNAETDTYTSLSGTFVPMNFRARNRNSLTERQQPSHANTTSTLDRDHKYSQFRTEGYVSYAFPTLFPTGAGYSTQP